MLISCAQVPVRYARLAVEKAAAKERHQQNENEKAASATVIADLKKLNQGLEDEVVQLTATLTQKNHEVHLSKEINKTHVEKSQYVEDGTSEKAGGITFVNSELQLFM